MHQIGLRAAAMLIASACASAHAQDADVARLRGARSLNCTLTWNYSTVFKDGKRALDSDRTKYNYQIDNIDIRKGTARLISRDRADDVTVKWDASALWIMSQSAVGNIWMTTIFPQYEVNTHNFIVAESRHTNFGALTAAGQSYGSCAVVQ